MAALSYSDSLTTGPSIEPLTADEARRNLDLDDTLRDADLSRWIPQARKRVEHDARIALINQTRTRKLHCFPADDHIELDGFAPLSSVTSVTYTDTGGSSQTFSSANYSVDTARKPGVIWLGYNQVWPTVRDTFDAVTIVYVVGHGTTASDVPQAAVSAMLLLIRHWFDYPEMAGMAQHHTNPEAYESLVQELSWGAYP